MRTFIFARNELTVAFNGFAAEAEELKTTKIVQDESDDKKKVSDFVFCVTFCTLMVFCTQLAVSVELHPC